MDEDLLINLQTLICNKCQTSEIQALGIYAQTELLLRCSTCGGFELRALANSNKIDKQTLKDKVDFSGYGGIV